MTDQIVSQRCRLNAKRIAAQRSKVTSTGPAGNTSNRQALKHFPYPSSPIRNSPEWQRLLHKEEKLLTDYPTDECFRRGCHVMEPHAHDERGIRSIGEEDRYNPEVEPPPTDSVRAEEDLDSAGWFNLGPKLTSSNLAIRTKIPRDLDLAYGNDSTSSPRDASTNDPSKSLRLDDKTDVPNSGAWHGSLAIHPSPQRNPKSKVLGKGGSEPALKS